MRKLITFLLTVIAVSVYARQITPEEAYAVASEFFNSVPKHYQGETKVFAKRAMLTKKVKENTPQPYYVFNADGNQGFVIISGDDRVNKILGYSDKGNFSNLPPQLIFLLNQYTKVVESLPSSLPTDSSWQGIYYNAPESEGVLLETANWGQGFPYNSMTPIINGEHCPTGCVATAMAIVMKYQQWPERYNWDGMSNIDEADENAPEIAKLMKDAGESVLMNYGLDESSANMNWVGHKLQQDFQYSPDCQYITSQNFTTEVWRDLIHQNLDNNNPIVYTATDIDNLSSHAFVIDGYNREKYHVNWGWDGLCNGYFDLEALCPNEELKFTANSGMVINITPDKSGKQYSKCFVDFGYFWTIDKTLGEAMNISEQDVIKGQPFHVINTLFTLPAGFIGEFGIAHVDKDGNIKEVLQTEKFDTWSNVDNEYKIMGQGRSYFNLIVNNDIEPTDKIQLVSREFNETDYRLVLGTLEWPSWVPVHGNVPRYGSVRWEISDNIKVLYNDFTGWEPGIGSPYIELSTSQDKTNFLRGSNVSIKCSPTDENQQGLIFMKIEGPQIYGTTQESDRNIETSVTIVGDYTVTAEWIELKDKSINLETAGTLKDVISEIEAKSIRDLEISGNMNAIDFWYLRDYCSNLTHLNLQNIIIEGVEAVDDRFSGTSSFQPANSLPEWALTGLSKLECVILPTSIEAILNNSLSALDLHFIVIPQDVACIGMNAFYGNQQLDVVCLLNPNPVEIEECVFVETGCPSNALLYVPEGSVEKYRTTPVWQDFRFIQEGEISQNIIHGAVIEDLVYDCYGPSACIVGYEGSPVNIDIPEKIEVDGEEYYVKSIKDRTFQDCISLESIVMPNTITSIGTDNIYLGYTFLNCSNLKNVKLSENLRKIPAGTFFNCFCLEQCVIPESVELIGMNAFYGAGLNEIYIPQNAKPEIMGFSAFSDNRNLKEYQVHPDNSSYKAIDGVLYRTDGEQFILESVPGLKNGTLEVADECTIVDMYSIGNNLETIIFNDNLKVIKDYAANGCPALSHITLPEKATIYTNAFRYCRNLKSVTVKQALMPNSEIFVGCDNLTTIYAQTDEGNLDISDLFDNEPENLNIYFEKVFPEYKYDGNAILWIPGGVISNNNREGNNSYKEMWHYCIDDNQEIILIEPQMSDINIDRVIINGQVVNADNYGQYHYNNSESSFATNTLPESVAPDVVIEYTLHGKQKMSTHYDTDFNASLPKTDLKPSMIEHILSDSNTPMDIYNIQGVLLKKNCSRQELQQFKPGIYIIRNTLGTIKISIK